MEIAIGWMWQTAISQCVSLMLLFGEKGEGGPMNLKADTGLVTGYHLIITIIKLMGMSRRELK